MVTYCRGWSVFNTFLTPTRRGCAGRKKEDMTLAGSMTIRIYDSEIREVYHDLGYWIINQTFWYPDNKYTEETAKEAFLNRDK